MLSTSEYFVGGNLIYSKPLLPRYNSYSTKNGALPLWSSRSTFDKEYLHVEVLADKEVDMEKSTDDVLNMNTYTCYICDTQVPKSYITEHNDGNKHKTCVKIADLALERTRKHMKSEIIKKLSIQVRETYFCEPCAVVVQNVDKFNHELSKKHVNSIRHDELLREFLMIYENKENIEYVAEKNDSDKIIDLNMPENIDFNNKNSPNDDTDESINIPPKESLNNEELIVKETPLELENETVSNLKVSNTDNLNKDLETLTDISNRMVVQLSDSLTKYFPEKTVTKPEKKDNLQKTKAQLVDYIKYITEESNTDHLISIEAISDKLILITALNGDKIKVPVTNFQSFHKQKGKTYCKLCEDPNVSVRHEDSEEHIEKIMIPINDKNAIRQIDDIWSHCILCNDLTRNIIFHLQSLLHRNKLKHCLVESTRDINQNILHKPQENTSQLIQEHSLIISHCASEITCQICDITIPNQVTSIKDHIKTFEHTTKYNNTIDENRLSEIDELQYYCTACDMCVAKCYALGHCNGKKHKKHLIDLMNKNKADVEECTQIILPSISQQIKRKGRSQNESDLICFVCNIVLSSVDKHMNSLDHKRNYFSYLEANKLNEIEEDTFYCIPCNTVILIDYLMYHCTSKKHKSHLKNFINNDNQEITNQTSVQLISENSHISRSITQSVQNAQSLTPQASVTSQNGVFDTAVPLKHLYQFREMSNVRKLLCTVCDEEVPYRKHEVKIHVNLIDHVVAFNLMMLWNKIKRLTDKYYCDVCKVDITYFNELSHVISAPHVSVMTNQPKGTVYEYDKKLLTLEYAMSHKVGDRVRPSSLISVVKPNDK